MLNKFNLDTQSINQIFSIKFVSVIIISIPSAIIADYFNIPLAWMLGPMIVTSIAALAGQLNVRGTPAFIIDEELIPGAIDLNTLIEKNNSHLIDKTTLLLNDIIPKNQELQYNQMQDKLTHFYHLINADTIIISLLHSLSSLVSLASKLPVNKSTKATPRGFAKSCSSITLVVIGFLLTA